MEKIIQSTLAKSPEYYKDVIKLIEESLNYEAKYSFEKDFWPLINPNNHKNCHILIDKKSDKVVAHIGVKKRDIRVKRNKYPVILLGGIVTDKDYRGQGHFKNLFNDIIKHYEDKCAFYLLWSEKDYLYEKYSFFEFGTIIQTGNQIFDEKKANELGFIKKEHTKLNEQEKIEVKELHDNNYKNYISFNRKARDWYDVSQIKSTDLYIKHKDQERQKEVIAYFYVNKGQDLKDIIHEVSFFSDEDMIEKLSPFKLWLPEKHQSYIEHQHALYIGLLRVGQKEKFTSFIQDVYSNDIFIKKMSDESVIFEFKDKEYNVTLKDFIQLTLGPKPAEEFVRYSPWIVISGLDSI